MQKENVNLHAEENEDWEASTVEPAAKLPAGWKWTMYSDGSGRLEGPDKQSLYSYDRMTYASAGEIEYRKSNNSSWDVFPAGSLDRFREWAEQQLLQELKKEPLQYQEFLEQQSHQDDEIEKNPLDMEDAARQAGLTVQRDQDKPGASYFDADQNVIHVSDAGSEEDVRLSELKGYADAVIQRTATVEQPVRDLESASLAVMLAARYDVGVSDRLSQQLASAHAEAVKCPTFDLPVTLQRLDKALDYCDHFLAHEQERALEQEAEKLTQAARYERNETRQGYHSDHYDRNLTTTSGDVTLHVPRLKGVSFETAIIERYRRRESSVEEALIEMYLADVSVRRVEDITEALWGSKVSPATISELNKKAYVHIEDWRNRPLQGGKYPYVYVDGIYLRRNWGGEYENVAILVAIAVNEDGYREVLDAAEGMKENKASWVNFFQWLKSRGLDGLKLIVGDKCLGMLEAVGEVFPDSKYQRCTVHFYRNVFSVVPRSRVKLVAKMLKAIHAQESKKAAREKAKAVVAQLKEMKLKEAAKKVEDSVEETLTYCDFPYEHWTRIRTNNVIEQLNREIRRRTRVVGTFPDGNSALMLVCARLRHVAGTQWGNKKYMNMKHLEAALEDVSIAG